MEIGSYEGGIMKKITIFILTIILTGCVRVTPVTLGDGTNAYELSCPGSARSYADCRNEAAEICGGKYKELDKDEYGGGAFVDYNTSMIFQVRQRRMTVVCK